MTILLNKPKPVTLLNRTDPLMRGLVCAAALNEPGGASRNLAGSGLLVGTPTAGGLVTDVIADHEPWYNDLGSGYSFVLWHGGISLTSWESLLYIGDGTLAWPRYSTSNYFKIYHNGSGRPMSNFLISEIADPGMLVCLWTGAEMRAYVDGVEVGNEAMAVAPKTDSLTSTFGIGGSGTVYQFLAFNRALSTDEIQRLYREPTALFREANFWPPAIAEGSVTHDLVGSTGATVQGEAAIEVKRSIAGSAGAAGSLTSSLKIDRAIAGACAGQASLSASLSTVGTSTLAATVSAISSATAALTVSSSQPEVSLSSQMDWLGEALFHGATAAAFQLGTVLTGGWFWTRHDECTAVYRGPSIGQVDFSHMLYVAHGDAREISLPDYLEHELNASYCYVARRFNTCGLCERTLTAAALLRFDDDGRLVQTLPNRVFGLKAGPIAGRQVRLAWSYCPLDQQAVPEVFRVYTDGGAGLIDFETPIAIVPYKGRKYYCCQTADLPEGLHRFAVAAERHDQGEPLALSLADCQVQTSDPEGLTLLAVEAIS